MDCTSAIWPRSSRRTVRPCRSAASRRSWDIYIERDMRNGDADGERAQELIDQLVIKLRIVRFLRAPDYDALFSGDPYWVTECIGGMDQDGRTLVTTYRFPHAAHAEQSRPGAGAQPDCACGRRICPTAFKRYCIKVSKETSSIQYENDDLMRPDLGDDCAIACCVSAMRSASRCSSSAPA